MTPMRQRALWLPLPQHSLEHKCRIFSEWSTHSPSDQSSLCSHSYEQQELYFWNTLIFIPTCYERKMDLNHSPPAFGMFILNLNQLIQVRIVHNAPEPWVQMAVASGNGRIWQSWAACRLCCWVWRNTRLGGTRQHTLCCSCWCWCCENLTFSTMGLTAGLRSALSSRVKCRACS